MDDKIFIPFSEDLLAAAGSPLGELVPYQLSYRCLRLANGVYEFIGDSFGPENRSFERAESPQNAGIADPGTALQSESHIVHAA